MSAIGGNAIGAEGGVSAMAAVVLGPIPGKAFAEVSGTAAVVPGNATHCAFGMVFVVCAAGGAGTAGSAIGNAVGAAGGAAAAESAIGNAVGAAPGKTTAAGSAVGNAIGAEGGVSAIGKRATGAVPGIGVAAGSSGAGAGMTCVCTVSAKRR